MFVHFSTSPVTPSLKLKILLCYLLLSTLTVVNSFRFQEYVGGFFFLLFSKISTEAEKRFDVCQIVGKRVCGHICTWVFMYSCHIQYSHKVLSLKIKI